MKSRTETTPRLSHRQVEMLRELRSAGEDETPDPEDCIEAGYSEVCDECEAVLVERTRCAAIVRNKKPPERRLWWLRDELEGLAKEIENG